MRQWYSRVQSFTMPTDREAMKWSLREAGVEQVREPREEASRISRSWKRSRLRTTRREYSRKSRRSRLRTSRREYCRWSRRSKFRTTRW